MIQTDQRHKAELSMAPRRGNKARIQWHCIGDAKVVRYFGTDLQVLSALCHFKCAHRERNEGSLFFANMAGARFRD